VYESIIYKTKEEITGPEIKGKDHFVFGRECYNPDEKYGDPL
jgi:hypothetical protein